MIDIRRVTKSFGGFKALDDVTLHVPSGSVYGLVGPNGAGKSTLIRHLMGVYRPDAGVISIGGKNVYDNAEVKQQTVCIYDEIFHYYNDSTRDLAKLYVRLYPTFSEQRYERLREAFPEVRDTVPVKRLSKGMQKQSAFWLALSCQPNVIVLDEPVDGLDPVMRRQVWSLLAGDVAERGTTVLLSSHNLRELEDVCDHVGVLHKGRVMLDRSLSELQEGITKVQVLFPETDDELPTLPLEILHASSMGRMQTFIVRATFEEVQAAVEPLCPQYLEVLPLSLEEIFIYELGGADYAVRNILL